MVSETWFPMIALFWGDVDLRHPEAGNVYYRVVSHEHHSALLEEINKLLDTNSRLDIRFAATWCLIVTWDNVGYYSNGRDKACKSYMMRIIMQTASVIYIEV